VVLFLIEFLIIKKVPGLIKDGRVFAVVMIVLILFFSWGAHTILYRNAHRRHDSFASNKTYSIGIGGAYAF
jgi:hypothetical protein